MIAKSARKHGLFNVFAVAHQIVGFIRVIDAHDVLLDDRALIKLGGNEVAGGADQLDAAREGLG